ncbi:MAG: hypothetical protein Q9N34_08040 [Aquificota bacterium]|nr:hypothetical protein [Aquificota bacterium]
MAKIFSIMLRRYLLIPALIGILVGISAVLFVITLDSVTRLVLEGLAGYHQPRPAGEGGYEGYTFPANPFLLPFLVAVGGFISGLLTHRFLLSPRVWGPTPL